MEAHLHFAKITSYETMLPVFKTTKQMFCIEKGLTVTDVLQKN